MISRETATRYSWGSDCEGWFLVQHPQMSVIQERMPPGAVETRHYHSRARQFFFVLSGALSIELGVEAVLLRPGQGREIAPGMPHQVHNEGSEDAEFLVISCPSSHGDRIQA